LDASFNSSPVIVGTRFIPSEIRLCGKIYFGTLTLGSTSARMSGRLVARFATRLPRLLAFAEIT
jgi:hypothetical protein